MFDNLSNWNTFDKTVTADHIDGVKIQTDSTHGFYLTYQTWNQGQGGFYPEVTSLQNDYAGSAGKPIQLLSIRAYKKRWNQANIRCCDYVPCFGKWSLVAMGK